MLLRRRGVVGGSEAAVVGGKMRGGVRWRVLVKGCFWRGLCVLVLVGMASREVSAQRGGRGAFAFLDVPVSPRIAGLGGKVASVGWLNTSGVGGSNPALISPAMHTQAEVSFSLYYAGVKYSNVAYFHQLPWGHMAGLSARQMWYGRFTRRDENGYEQGTFAAYDFTFSLHYAAQLGDYISVGASITPIFSHLEQYSAFGVVIDAGAQFISGDGLFTAALVAKNFGGSIIPYTTGHREWAPFELVAGLSYRLERAPFRFIFTLQHLEDWKQRFFRPDSYTDNLAELSGARQEARLGDRLGAELLAHPIFAVEIEPSRYFFLQVGYNLSRGAPLGLQGNFFLEGLSYGFGVNIRRFGLHFSRSHYHRAGATNHLAIYWRWGSSQRAGMHLSGPSASMGFGKE